MTTSRERDPVAPDPRQRFSDRVDAYVRYRPAYPPELIAWMRSALGFEPSWRVADVGSGTGVLTRLLLANGNTVHAVEPNAAMRASAEATLGHETRFASVAGSAEATTLADHSVHLVTAAQAFHWFDLDPTRHEWKRILVPGGYALVVFNSRRIDASPFMRAYDTYLTRHAVDYTRVDHRRATGAGLRAFLGDGPEWHFAFALQHTWEAVRGLSMSSSYVPAPGHPAHETFFDGLERLVQSHLRDGVVEFLYETEAYAGRLG